MPPKLILLPLAALAIVACWLPASAFAGELVPPGNSAVNQYTETFPTSKGEEKETGEKKKGATPNQVLGSGKAHKLEDHGPVGKAVAEFTAETAAPESEASGGETGGSAGDGKNQGKKQGGQGKGKPDKSGGEGSEGGETQQGGAGGGSSAGPGPGSDVSGSSAVGEIASQATGTASESVGLWLPLLVIAVVAWSAFYVWRNRRQRVV